MTHLLPQYDRVRTIFKQFGNSVQFWKSHLPSPFKTGQLSLCGECVSALTNSPGSKFDSRIINVGGVKNEAKLRNTLFCN